MFPIRQASGFPDDVYGQIVGSTDVAVGQLFSISENIYDDFAFLFLACGAIYVALFGVAVMSGRMYMSPQDAAIRISKLIIVLVLFGSFASVAQNAYGLFYVVPESLAAYFAEVINPSLTTESTGVALPGGAGGSYRGERVALGGFVQGYSEKTSEFIGIYNTKSPFKDVTGPLFLWVMCMAPIVASLIIIVLSKLVMVILLFLLPLIATAALFGRGYSFLTTWAKVLITLGLTVILTYLAFVLMMTLLDTTLTVLVEEGRRGAVNQVYTIGQLFPVGILALITYILISQVPSIAGAIVGAAGVNTQQVGGFINIAGLRAANPTQTTAT